MRAMGSAGLGFTSASRPGSPSGRAVSHCKFQVANFSSSAWAIQVVNSSEYPVVVRALTVEAQE